MGIKSKFPIEIKKASNKINDVIPHLPKGSTLLGDPEYDVEENYREAHKFGLELMLNRKKWKHANLIEGKL